MKPQKKLAIFSALLAVVLLISGCMPQRTPVPASVGLPVSTAVAELADCPPGYPDCPEYIPGEDRLSPLFSISPMANVGLNRLSATTLSQQFNLTVYQGFRVTRPARQDGYRVNTQLAAFFITGTSNPGLPLLFNGSPVERLGTLGTWGVHVQLGMGENVFTASQGGETTTIVINRMAPPVASPINAIIQNSMFPAVQGGVSAGGFIPVEAVAPSGSSVIATFAGQSVALTQVAAANPGIPATFRGQLPVAGGFPAGVTTLVGPISYQLNQGGNITNFQSSGNMFVAGEGSHIAVRVTALMGLVVPNPAQPLNIGQVMQNGATDFVYSQTNTHFQLFSGGHIPTNHVQIIEGPVSIGNSFSSVQASSHNRRESFVFMGTGQPAYRTDLQGGVFSITFFNSAGAPPISSGSSTPLFSSVSSSQNPQTNTVTYSFTLRNPADFWGYHLWFEQTGQGTNTVLQFRQRPAISGIPGAPLSGVSVMIDPGHGGTDPGAVGIAAGLGPDENLLAMANSFALRDELTALGANVILTRTELGQTMSLDERLSAFVASGADLFISVHLNSVVESTNANTVTGAEVFFHNAHSAGISTSVLDGLVAATGRNRRQSNQAAFRVTLLPMAPSMLLELGFMSHPVEYEQQTSPEVILLNARGVAEGIVSFLS